MRLWALMTLFLLVIGRSTSTAQMEEEIPSRPMAKRFDLFGGISYANISLFDDRKHVLGWAVALTANVHRNFGIAFDFAGQYDPDCAEDDEDCLIDLLLQEEIQNYSSHQILIGPQLKTPRGNTSVFAHVLVGGVRTRLETIVVDTKERSEFTSGMKFAMGFGGGVDWSIANLMGLRIVQLDYIPVRDEDVWRHNLRIQGGFLFHF